MIFFFHILLFLSPDRSGQQHQVARSRSATNGTNTPTSNHNHNDRMLSPFSTASNPTPDFVNYYDNTSTHSSLRSPDSDIGIPRNKSCSDISTQTDDLPLSKHTGGDRNSATSSNIPTPLRKKLANAFTGGSPASSKIPRPLLQRSKTMELPSSSKLKRRNSTNSGTSSDRSTTPRAPRIHREKSQPNFRREKSDLSGQPSKYKMVSSPGPRRRGELF